MKYILICAAGFAYPISILIDCSIYNLRFLLVAKEGVKYWLSILTVYQYSARFFMLIFIPTTAYITEQFQSYQTTFSILFIAHIGVTILLGISVRFFKLTSIIGLQLIKIISLRSQKNSFQEAFFVPIQLNSPLSFKQENAKKLFISSLASQFMISLSMTLIFVLNFINRDSILFYNSLMQALNMFASILLFLFIDPIVMKSFERKYEGQNNLKILYYSRILAHSLSVLFFTFLYLQFI